MSSGKASGAMDAIVVDGDELSRMTVASYLGNQGIRVAAAVDNVASGINLIRGIRPQILILELPESPEGTLEAVRRIRNDHPDLGIIISSHEMSSDLILRALRAGAQEFLIRPLDFRELGDAVGRLGARSQNGKRSHPREGKLVVVSAGKGGVGATSVAANVAVSLARNAGTSAVLVDMNPTRSDIGVMLDLHPPRTLADLVSAGPLDEETLESAFGSHECGLSILSVNETSEQASKISPIHLVESFGLLEQMFDYVVVDAGSVEDERITEVIPLGDLFILVTVLDVLSVRNLARKVEFLRAAECPPERLLLVVNRFEKKTRVSLEDLKAATGLDELWKLPNDWNTMSMAIDSGTPAVIQAPKSRLTRSFAELSAGIAERCNGARDRQDSAQ